MNLQDLLKSKIKSIEVSASSEFGEPTIQLYSIELEDGTKFWVEGEHDIAYLDGDYDKLHKDKFKQLCKENDIETEETE